MKPWPLTGRAEELSVLQAVLGGCDGDDAGVVIAGRPGVGKTRLAREAAAEASSRGWAVRWVVGTAAAQSLPLGPFAQWITELDANPLRLVSDVIAAITASAQGEPVLIAVDDAHLLDDLSAFALYQLIFRRAATVIATLRSGERASDAVTALWKDAHLRRLDLQPLSRRQSETLLESVLGGPLDIRSADRMWRMTWGNVLFLQRLVTQELDARRLIPGPDGWQWTGAMAVTESLIDLIDAQIGVVPDAVGDVVDFVAIAEPLELDYLKRLADPGAVEDCERRGLITVSPAQHGEVARVGHPLYGEVRRAQAGRVRLARLRGRVAQAMIQADGAAGATDPVRLGQLWLASDLAPDAGILTLAAQGAYGRLDLTLTSRFADDAAAAGAGLEAQLLLAHTLSLGTNPERAQDILDALAAQRLPPDASSFVGQIRASNLLWPLGRPDASWAVIDEALGSSSSQTVAEAQAFRAIQLATAARPHEVLTTTATIDRTQLGALPALMLAWGQTIALGDLGQPQQAATVALDAHAAATAAPEIPVQTPGMLLCAVQALVLGGDVARAQGVADDADRQWTDVPGIYRIFAAAISGMAAVAAGDVRAAHERLRACVAESELVGIRSGLHYYFSLICLETLAYRADPDAINDAVELVSRAHHPAYAFLEPRAQLATARVSAAAGRLAEARIGAQAAAACAQANGQHAWEVCCRQAAIQFGDTTQATRLTELAIQVQGPRAALVARWADGVAHHDAEILSAVSYDFEAIGDRIAAADAAAHAAVAFRRHGQRGSALTASVRAARIITDCGATTPATRAAATRLPLTDREREIGLLVSQGMSNKEIAKVLTVSVRTVENHIYRACSNLGVANRDELGFLVSQLA